MHRQIHFDSSTTRTRRQLEYSRCLCRVQTSRVNAVLLTAVPDVDPVESQEVPSENCRHRNNELDEVFQHVVLVLKIPELELIAFSDVLHTRQSSVLLRILFNLLLNPLLFVLSQILSTPDDSLREFRQ